MKITFRKIKPDEILGNTLAVTAIDCSVLYFFEKANDDIGLLVKHPTQGNLIANEPITSIKNVLKYLTNNH